MRLNHNPNSGWPKGEPRSEITVEKMSKYMVGRKLRLGLPVSDETRQKLSDANRGKFCGSKSPNWRGGTSFGQYCEKFNNEFKERVHAFFGYHCVICGQVWHPGDEKLHVHHVNYNKTACCDESKRMFVPLCRACHNLTSAPNKRGYWRDVFTKLIEQNYGGKSYFTKEEMMGITAPSQ